MSYSGNLSTNLDWIRFIIGDTSEERLTDTEINNLLTLYGTREKAAISAMERILIFIADEVDVKIGPTEVKKSDKYRQYQAYYKQMKAQLQTSSMNPQEITTGPNIFSIGMMDDGGRYGHSTKKTV